MGYNGLETCPNPTGYFYRRDNKGSLEKVPKGCGCWDCPYCGPKKQKKLYDDIRYGADFIEQVYGGRMRFMTLTLSPLDDDRDIMTYWARLRASLAKHGYKGYDFFLVKEFTKKGRRHLHVAISVWIPKAVLSALWQKATGHSFVVWISSRKIRNMAAYMSKYMGKALTDTEHSYRYKERRYSSSKKWPKIPKPDKKPSAWVFVYGPHSDIGLRQLIIDAIVDKKRKLREFWASTTLSKDIISTTKTGRHYRPPKVDQVN